MWTTAIAFSSAMKRMSLRLLLLVLLLLCCEIYTHSSSKCSDKFWGDHSYCRLPWGGTSRQVLLLPGDRAHPELRWTALNLVTVAACALLLMSRIKLLACVHLCHCPLTFILPFSSACNSSSVPWVRRRRSSPPVEGVPPLLLRPVLGPILWDRVGPGLCTPSGAGELDHFLAWIHTHPPHLFFWLSTMHAFVGKRYTRMFANGKGWGNNLVSSMSLISS